MSVERRGQRIEPGHPRLSMTRKCEQALISRSGFHHRPAGETLLDLGLIRRIDPQFLEAPCYGSRQMVRHLRREGYAIEALEEALKRFGWLDSFSTDQGIQFTSPRFTGMRQDAGVRIAMDERERWMDKVFKVFIERLWRSLKYECVYVQAPETGSKLRAGLSLRIRRCNARRPHSAVAGRTSDEAYGEIGMEKMAA